MKKAQENYFLLKAIEELKIQREQESLADKSTVTISRKMRKQKVKHECHGESEEDIENDELGDCHDDSSSYHISDNDSDDHSHDSESSRGKE